MSNLRSESDGVIFWRLGDGYRIAAIYTHSVCSCLFTPLLYQTRPNTIWAYAGVKVDKKSRRSQRRSTDHRSVHNTIRASKPILQRMCLGFLMVLRGGVTRPTPHPFCLVHQLTRGRLLPTANADHNWTSKFPLAPQVPHQLFDTSHRQQWTTRAAGRTVPNISDANSFLWLLGRMRDAAKAETHNLKYLMRPLPSYDVLVLWRGCELMAINAFLVITCSEGCSMTCSWSLRLCLAGDLKRATTRLKVSSKLKLSKLFRSRSFCTFLDSKDTFGVCCTCRRLASDSFRTWLASCRRMTTQTKGNNN